MSVNRSVELILLHASKGSFCLLTPLLACCGMTNEDVDAGGAVAA